jgi:hypothetical protein
MLVSNQIFVSAMFPRAVFEETGDFYQALFGPEDYDLWLRILELGYSVVDTPDALAVYRILPTSVSSHPTRMARSLQLTYSRAIERGKLTRRQQRIARRQLRLQRALEQVSLSMAERRTGGHAVGRIARNTPLFIRVAAENPDRWIATARVLAGRGTPFSQVTK